MAVPSGEIALAPYRLRHRISVAGLLIAWLLAAFFFMLAVRERSIESRTDAAPAPVVSALSH